jgi:hypothetical protein
LHNFTNFKNHYSLPDADTLEANHSGFGKDDFYFASPAAD